MNIETIQSLSSMKIDMDKIYTLQEKYWELIDMIDAKRKPDDERTKKEGLSRLVEDRMYKYAFRLAEEYKLKKEEDIRKMFYETIQDIFDYSWSLVEKKWEVTQEEIHVLHTKLFPKWLWGTTIWPKWEKFKKLYPMWEYRKERDFTKYKWWEHDYPDFNNIPELVDIINDFLYNEDYKLHILIRIILYCAYIVWVHPFYNGNGTTYIIVLSILLVKNWYDIPKGLLGYIKTITPDILINARHNLDYEPLIRGFLELFPCESTKN